MEGRKRKGIKDRRKAGRERKLKSFDDGIGKKSFLKRNVGYCGVFERTRARERGESVRSSFAVIIFFIQNAIHHLGGC